MEADEKDTVQERWAYGGQRVSAKRAVNAWIDESNNEMWFKAGGSFTVGGVYEVSVIRNDGRVSMVGTPRFLQLSGDNEFRERLAVNSRAARTELNMLSRERTAKSDDPLELAIANVAELIRKSQVTQRQSLLAYVTAKIVKESW